MFKSLSMMIAATLLFLPFANVIAAPKECSSFYCYDPAAAAKAKEKKKARMRRSGYPERLIAMVDELADCVGCVETAPDGFQIKIVFNNGNYRQFGWNRHSEYLARKDLKSGKIKSFHLVYTRTACECCDCRDGVQAEPVGEPKKGISIDFTDPQKLGAMPPDLFKPRAGRKPPSAQIGDIERPTPPRIAQALCPACKHLADKLNELNEERYQWQKERHRILKNIRAIQQGIQNDIDKLSELNDLASSPEVINMRAKQQRIYEAHVADLKREKQKLQEVEKKISELEDEIAKVEAELLACEKTCLKKRERRYDDRRRAEEENQFGVHLSFDSQKLDSRVISEAGAVSPGDVTYRYSDIGLDLALRIPGYPFYVYVDGSKSFEKTKRIFDELTSGEAASNSTVDVTYKGQFFAGIAFIPYESATLSTSVGVGRMLLKQEMNAQIVESGPTQASDSKSVGANSFFVVAQKELCHHCFLNHSVAMNAKIFASKLPEKLMQVTVADSGNTYTVHNQGFWQYSARLGLGMLF